jgi:phage-related protein
MGGPLNAISNFVNGAIQLFERLKAMVVGGSIVPDMVNLISNVLQAGGATWNATVGAALSNLENTFSSDMNSIENTVSSIWGNIVNTMQTMAQNAVNGVQSTLSALPGIVSGIVNQIPGIISSVEGAAFSAGNAVGDAIGNGLNAAAGWVASAASNLAGIIASVLPHSPAETGPLSKLDTFMPGMINTLVDGMLSGTSKLQAASVQVARAAGAGFTGGATGSSLAPLSGNAMANALLGQILSTLQAQGRVPALGAAPVSSTLPSITQQIGSVNISGVQNVQTLYNQLNALAGVKYENALRGAINP